MFVLVLLLMIKITKLTPVVFRFVYGCWTWPLGYVSKSFTRNIFTWDMRTWLISVNSEYGFQGKTIYKLCIFLLTRWSCDLKIKCTKRNILNKLYWNDKKSTEIWMLTYIFFDFPPSQYLTYLSILPYAQAASHLSLPPFPLFVEKP